jgi:hypothetical protein
MESEQNIEKTNSGIENSDQPGIEDDDEFCDDEELMPKALPVEGDPLPPGNIIPSDANEYLRQVRWEAEQYQDNFVATHLINVKQEAINHHYGPNSYLFEFFQSGSNQKKGFLDELSPEWKKKVIEEFINTKKVPFLIFCITN